MPQNEAERIQVLHSLLMLDTPAETRFDNLTRVAATFFRVPIALVTLVDSRRQWFKSACGVPMGETPREVSFCGHAILQDDVMVVEDALDDQRFFDNPYVTGAPGVRFYAGAPLKVGTGAAVGTLCLIDCQPRRLQSFELEMLADLAKLVAVELQRAAPLQTGEAQRAP
ncbi:GAF domain-containing protein [Chitiniphilus eburneus]|uniref:GAF domain-containing protein n=2 Tax=Chitiniphilus eburneus TaxID=2571148 RepID=A0A4U0PUE3_9NEIS|nr:GAF domain-containing protein [Chitiniphilus eburneus]